MIQRLYIASLVAFVLAGMCTHVDYGIAWDEAAQREYGKAFFEHIGNEVSTVLNGDSSNTATSKYAGTHYGLLFQTVAYSLEKAFGFTHARSYFYLRHVMVWICFFVALLVFHRILLQRFKNAGLALLGMTMLMCSPRIYAHAFFNVKDIVFLSFYLFALYSLLRFMTTGTHRWAGIHAFFTLMAISSRIMGVYLYVLTICLLPIVFWLSARNDFRHRIRAVALYALLVPLCLVLLAWISGLQPIDHIAGTLKAMAKFDWTGNVLLDGVFYNAQAVPWFYTLRWMHLTLPPTYQALIIIGLGLCVIRLVGSTDRSVGQSFDTWTDIVMLCAWLGPLLAVILLRSTLYDGWRHMYFIYPPLLFFGMYAASVAFEKWRPLRSVRLALTVAGVVVVLYPLITMIRMHPYQHIYFNALATKPWVEHYDLDYWGVGYKHALRSFAQTLDGETASIIGSNYPAWESYKTLPEALKKDMTYVFRRFQASHYLSNFRFKEERDAYLEGRGNYQYPLMEIEVCGQPIYGVFCIAAGYTE